MSSREERRLWQEFRESHGATVKQFRARWQAMFNRDPTPSEIDSFRTKKNELTANLGSHAKKEAPVDEMAEAKRRAEIVGITRRYEWDMAHRIPEHDGKCRRLHGHRYAAEIQVGGTLQAEGPATGMVMDFNTLDKHVDSVIGFWDHRTMLHTDDTLMTTWDDTERGQIRDYEMGVFRVPFIPTAENITLHIKRELKSAGVNVWSVRVYETPRSWAEA